MTDVIVALVKAQTKVTEYQKFIDALEGIKGAERLHNNYSKYLSREKSKVSQLSKSIQNLYPPTV